MAMTAYLRPAGGLALVGLLGWTTAEALNEALVYKHCRRSALCAHVSQAVRSLDYDSPSAVPVQSH